jgi:repressor LexA
VPGQARGIRLVLSPAADLVPAAGDDPLRLPILGQVAAGLPIGADAGVQDMVLLDRVFFSPAPDYLLRVKGDSMRDEGILHGDLIGVHRTADARSGQIVVARLGEEVTVKRLKRRGREITLVAENTAFAPIVVDPAKTSFAIEGVAVGVIRPSRSL